MKCKVVNRIVIRKFEIDLQFCMLKILSLGAFWECKAASDPFGYRSGKIIRGFMLLCPPWHIDNWNERYLNSSDPVDSLHVSHRGENNRS